MIDYIGTKQLKGQEITLGDYNEYRGWEMPDDEDPSMQGYLVEYTDGGDANDDRHAGYISWSPKDVFELAYQDPRKGVTFGHAIELLKQGKKLARSGWNGKGMWIILVPGNDSIRPVAGTPYSNAGLTEEIAILPHIDMYTINSEGRRAMLPGWLASQTDILETDWVLVD